MLGREIFVEVNVMHRQGKSIRLISRELGISRNTVRRRLRAEQVPVAEARSRKPTKLDNYRGYLQTRIAAAKPDWIPATVLFDEIQAQGYTGCVTTVRNYVRTMKPEPRLDPVVRFVYGDNQDEKVATIKVRRSCTILHSAFSDDRGQFQYESVSNQGDKHAGLPFNRSTDEALHEIPANQYANGRCC